MRIYESSDGKWILFIPRPDLESGGIKLYFDTETEAREAMSKLTFAKKARGLATTYAQLKKGITDLKTVYYDRTYQAGGANALVDDDVSGAGTTAALISSFVTFAEQFEKWAAGEFATVGGDGQGTDLAIIDHDSVLNQLREDI